MPIFFNWYLSNEKTAFVDKSKVEPTILFIEKISFSLKLFSGHFYGQSFIKTVQGPLRRYQLVCEVNGGIRVYALDESKYRSLKTFSKYLISLIFMKKCVVLIK